MSWTRLDTHIAIYVVVVTLSISVPYVLLVGYFQKIDTAFCASKGYRARPSPGRSVRLVCIDDQGRLVWGGPRREGELK